MRYEVYLPIKDNDEQCLQLNIYSTKNRDEATREQYKSKEVQDILNHIKVKYDKEAAKKKETTKDTKKETEKKEETKTN